jgi:GNAT superfamily N-acetyltransferase
MSEVRQVHAASRGQLARLLDERSAGDAMAAYYALHHSADSVKLYAYHPGKGGPTGFLAVARTGLDLFRPLVVPFVGQASALKALLLAALESARPVVLHLPLEQRSWAQEVVRLTGFRIYELLRLDPEEYHPVVNVLVMEATSPGGSPRYEIRSGELLRAASGVNWKGSTFAEVYLEVEPSSRGQGYGKSVLAANAGRLLSGGVVALYRVADDDLIGRREAAEVGFRPTGVRTLVGQAVLRQEASSAPKGRDP